MLRPLCNAGKEDHPDLEVCQPFTPGEKDILPGFGRAGPGDR
jgi:hypothetical protein